jgi:hypothetical protein
MPLADADVPGSDTWWMVQLARQLRDKQDRFARLENYRRGTPPHPSGTEHLATEPLYRFHKQCRSNFADVAVKARTDRLGIRTVRTAAGGDDDGDVQATRLLQASGLATAQGDLFRLVGTFGEAYTAVWAPARAGDWPLITAEDPREMIAAVDPADPRRLVAALKLFHDDLAGMDYALLWRPGRKVVAYRPRKARASGWLDAQGRVCAPRVTFSPGSFDLSPDVDDPEAQALSEFLLRSETYALDDLPVRHHQARDGVGVFELHTDLLDRINHMILQRVVIATLQAFRQRAIELVEDLPEYDPATGQKVDYNDLFAADPGALWKLPVGAKIWESGQVDLSGILASVKDDVQHFGSVTATPFSMLSSDSVNQSAEGAQLTREGLVFAVEDLQRLETQPLVETLSLAFRMMPDDVRYADGADRADVAGMAIDWLPAERYSLAERAQADSQALSLPRRQKLARIWGLTPAEIDVAMGQAAEDAMLASLNGQPRDRTSPAGTGSGGGLPNGNGVPAQQS